MKKFLKKCIQYPLTAFIWLYTIVVFTLHRMIAPWASRLFYKDRHWGVIDTSVPFLKGGFHLMGARLSCEGLENIPKAGPFVLVSNHQSLIDIVIFLILMPRRFSFMAKKELLKVPLLGWEIPNMGHWVIDRHDHHVAMKQMEGVRKGVEAGIPLLVFPEGTRSLDDTVQEFKRGPFMIAAQTGVPVIPCRIEGAWRVLNKKSLLIWPGKIKLTVYPPVQVRPCDGKKPLEKAEAIRVLEICHKIIAPRT